MIVCLDVSAAVEILYKRKKSVLFYDNLLNAQNVIAPNIYVEELTNTIWKSASLLKEDLEICNKRLFYTIDYIKTFYDDKALCKEALRLGVKYNHSTYDMFYLALAKRERAFLMTCDNKLKNLAEKTGVKTV